MGEQAPGPGAGPSSVTRPVEFVERNQLLRELSGMLATLPSPEAHFNRAICLLHLDRGDDAAVGLRPFARGRWRGYRQSEARELLESIGVPMR